MRTTHNAMNTNFDTLVGQNLNAPYCDDDVVAEGSEDPSSGDVSFPCHQPEEDDEPWVPTEAEKDAAERASKGVKRPRSPIPFVDPDDDALPNLAEIFDNYDVPLRRRVSLCRAYASYVSSLLPKQEKKKKASKPRRVSGVFNK